MKIHSAALTEYLFQDLQQFLLFPICHDRIRNLKLECLFIRKFLIGLDKQRIKKRIIVFQLQRNTFLINWHQTFRRILPGKVKFFNYLHSQVSIRKKLVFDVILQLQHVFLKNQPVTRNINMHKIPAAVHRHSFNRHVFQ